MCERLARATLGQDDLAQVDLRLTASVPSRGRLEQSAGPLVLAPIREAPATIEESTDADAVAPHLVDHVAHSSSSGTVGAGLPGSPTRASRMPDQPASLCE